MSAAASSVLPLLQRYGPQLLRIFGPAFINKLHGLAVSELNRKVNSVTQTTNANGIKNQIRSVINSPRISNSNRAQLKNLLSQLKNRAQQSIK